MKQLIEKIKKYESFSANLKWHIKTNKPDDEQLQIIETRITDIDGMVKDLKEIATHTQGREVTEQEIESEGEKWASDCYDKNDPDKYDLWLNRKYNFISGAQFYKARQSTPSKGEGWKGEIQRRQQLILSEPDGVVRETMIQNLLMGFLPGIPTYESRQVQSD